MIKQFRSDTYNYNFNTETGYFERWGETEEDDPIMAPFPEILDIEISTVCHGPAGGPCKFCYKSNTGRGKRMSLSMFNEIAMRLPKEVTQIAFGIGDLDDNEDMWSIFALCRSIGIIPNVTINGAMLTEQRAERLADLMGAVSVSLYDKDECYNAVQLLRESGVEQVNIHAMLSEETYQLCLSVLDDVKRDSRLSSLNAVVFLALKPKGRGKHMTPLTTPSLYRRLVKRARSAGIAFGMDSCSAPSFLFAAKDWADFDTLVKSVDPCESGLFSLYINVDGEAFPCSFTEGTEGWKTGIPAYREDFVKHVWNHERIREWRDRLLSSTKSCNCRLSGICRKCPVYRNINAC